VDSAVCDGCGSTRVVYDIEFDQDLISEVAKLTGRSETQVKDDLEKVYAKLSKD
jgi:DNA-directed RNA polymerase delta subunit